MSEVNPPLVIEAASHDADLLRQLWSDTYTPGVMSADHLEVTEQATPALGVTVAAGRAIVAGDESSTQGVYYVSNTADVDVALATADATNDRIDLIVARVKDSFYSGGDDEWDLEAVTGTPAGAPVAPAAPANSYVLSEVEVPADPGGNPAITDSDITDMRSVSMLRSAALPMVKARTRNTTNTSFATASRTVSVTVPIPADWASYDVELEITFDWRSESGSNRFFTLEPLFQSSGVSGQLWDQRVVAGFYGVASASGFFTGQTATGDTTASFVITLNGVDADVTTDDVHLIATAYRVT